MARIPLIDEHATPDIAALVAKIRGARGGQLHVFYRALLHTPGLASAWFDFNNAVRFQTGLGDRVRELIIMRVAALTGCDYVWNVHEAKYAAPAGVTPQRGRGPARLAQVRRLRRDGARAAGVRGRHDAGRGGSGCRVRGTARRTSASGQSWN